MAVENVRGHKLQQRDCSRLLLKSGASRVGKERPPYPKLHSLWLALCPLLCESDECCWPRIPSSLNVTGPSMSTEAEAVLRLSNNWTITLVFWTDLTVDLHGTSNSSLSGLHNQSPRPLITYTEKQKIIGFQCTVVLEEGMDDICQTSWRPVCLHHCPALYGTGR